MDEFTTIIQNYSIKFDRKIKRICSPLIDCLNIPIFSYAFIESDGSFGYLTTAIEFNEYYFLKNLHLDNPYLSHPALFRSGHTLCPCGFDEKTQKELRKKFNAMNFVLNVQSNGSQMEHFIYANSTTNFTSSTQYLDQLDLFKQFGEYFKREARDIIGQMKTEQYNICAARGKKKFEEAGQVPLRNNDLKILAFLKHTSGLSLQELHELESFKRIPFTKREKDVLDQLLLGHYSSEIAKNLFLSNKTIEHHIENIKEKLDCKSKFDLIKKIRDLDSIGYLI